MKKVTFLLIAILLQLSSYAQDPKTPNIRVSAKSEIEVEPDIIHLSIRLSEDKGNKKISVEQKETLLKGILAELNIDQKNLTLSDALSQFDRSFWKRDEVKTSKIYDLKLTTAQELSKVLIACREKELSDVKISHVDHSQKTRLMKQARIKAIQAAKEKAKYLTEAVGQKIGKVLSISEQPIYWPSRPQMINAQYSNVMMAAENDMASDVGFKKIKIVAEIVTVFEIL